MLVVRAPSGRRQQPRELHGRTTTCSKAGSASRRSGWASVTRFSAATGTASFQMPLGTLHAFQGWADKFLATPAAGIEDTYVKLSYPMGKRGAFTNINAVAFFHDYTAEQGRRALRLGAEPSADRAHREDGAHAQVHRLPRRSAAHRHRQALVVGGLRVLSERMARRGSDAWKGSSRWSRKESASSCSSATEWPACAPSRSCSRSRRTCTTSRCSAAEPHGNYNRILLSPVLASEKTVDDIMLNTREWYADTGSRCIAGDEVVKHRPRSPARDLQEQASRCRTTE